MDYTQFSTEDLQALSSGDLTAISTSGLKELEYQKSPDYTPRQEGETRTEYLYRSNRLSDKPDAPKEEVGVAEDAGRSLASGLVRGIPKTADAVGAVIPYLTDKANGGDLSYGEIVEGMPLNNATSEVFGEEYQPQHYSGKMIKTAGEVISTLPLAGTKAVTAGNVGRAGGGGLLSVPASDAGGTIGEKVGGETGRQVGAITGAIAGGVAGFQAPEIAKGLGRAAQKTGSGVTNAAIGKVDDAAAADLSSQGIDVTRANASDQGATIVHNYFKNTMLGRKAISASGDRIKGQLTQSFDDVITKVGKETDAASAGEQVIQGLKQARTSFKEQTTTLYDEVAKFIPETKKTSLSNLSRLEYKVPDKLKNTAFEDVAKNSVADVHSIIEGYTVPAINASKNGGISYEAAKQLRTSIGKALESAKYGTPEHSAYSKLYTAVSKDMDELAHQVGGKAAESAKEASRFYKKGIVKLEQLNKKFAGNKDAEQVIKTLASADLQKTSPKRIQSLLDTIPEKNRKIVSATILKRMGQKADEGQFNMSGFATRWENIAPKTKEALTGSSTRAAELDTFARNVRRSEVILDQSASTGIRTAGGLSDAGGLVAGASFAFSGNLSILPYILAKGAVDKFGSILISKPQTVKAFNAAVANQGKETSKNLALALANTVQNTERRTVLKSRIKQKKPDYEQITKQILEQTEKDIKGN